MALWSLQNLPDEIHQQISSAYNNEVFPFEVRLSLGEWLDKQPWSTIVSEQTPENEIIANNLHQEYIFKINSFIHSIDSSHGLTNPLKCRLTQAVYNAQHRNPLDIANIIHHSLQKESRIMSYAQDALCDTKPMLPVSFQEMNRSIQRVRSKIADLDTIIRQNESFQNDDIIITHQNLQKCNALLQSAQSNEGHKLLKQMETYEHNLKMATETQTKQRTQLIEILREISNSINILMKNVLEDELERWSRGQQLLGNGVMYTGNTLDEIQDWCEALADFILHNRNQIKQIQNLCSSYNPNQFITDSLYNLLETNAAMLSQLVKSTFVIEKQPPQVMKTNTRFAATVRLLVGYKLGLHLTPPNVSVHIISEHQAALLNNFSEDTTLQFIQNESAAGEILNNVGSMEYHQTTTHLSVHFRNMQLKKIKRTEKKGTESVMDEKFALLFNSRFIIQQDATETASRISCCVQTFSLPVVVIVHGNQEPHAHATITWDNAFAEQRRTSFNVPDKVPFYRVGEVLSQKFAANVGKGLNRNHLHFLACKALRTNSVSDLSVPITWSQFSKEPIPERSFTFWEWFYSVLKITKEHLRSLWNEGLIHGFISREDTINMLSSCPLGTFILRFSDSEQGGVTVAWKGKCPQTNNENCYMLQPFNAKDLGIRSFADRIFDLPYLTHLYPDRPKDSVFSKYYTPIGDNTKTTTGYVKPVLVTCVPGLSPMTMESFPNTPQSTIQPHSPGDSNSMPFETSTSQSSMDCSTVKHNGIHTSPSATNTTTTTASSTTTPFELVYLQDNLVQSSVTNQMAVPIDFSTEGFHY